MLGLSMAPATGKLVAEMLGGRAPVPRPQALSRQPVLSRVLANRLKPFLVTPMARGASRGSKARSSRAGLDGTRQPDQPQDSDQAADQPAADRGPAPAGWPA